MHSGRREWKREIGWKTEKRESNVRLPEGVRKPPSGSSDLGWIPAPQGAGGGVRSGARERVGGPRNAALCTGAGAGERDADDSPTDPLALPGLVLSVAV